MKYEIKTLNGRKFIELEDGWAFHSNNGDLIGGYSSLESAVEASMGW